ncbi:MAG: N-acetylneuraminate synthase [Candidatus Pacebacteria bacterium]|nr:N-acetylneuraminate synthase [Candidatus Paceibacterota bacterium]
MKRSKRIKVSKKRYIGISDPCFVIAEAGVNHNKSLVLAKKLVDAAKYAGADAVKFQTFKSENLVTFNSSTAKHQKKKGKKETQLEFLKSLELSYQSFKELKKYCDKKGIIFLSAPHTEDAIDFLEPLVPLYKIGSGDLNNYSFLMKVAEKKKPIILSTGMGDLKEIKSALSVLKKAKNNRIIILHCTTSYPCPIDKVNLRAMETLRREFGLMVGYSDHTLTTTIPQLAAALGAKVIEKHFTLNKNMIGPDHKSSLEPKELKTAIKLIREAEKAMGDGIKKPYSSEQVIKKIVRKSIVAKKDIIKGLRITKDMLDVKRPGTGIEPKYLNKIIGKFAKKNIKKDELISWKNIY